MAEQPPFNIWIKGLLPADLLQQDAEADVIKLLVDLPITPIQAVDIIIQWLVLFDRKMTPEIATELGN